MSIKKLKETIRLVVNTKTLTLYSAFALTLFLFYAYIMERLDYKQDYMFTISINKFNEFYPELFLLAFTVFFLAVFIIEEIYKKCKEV